LSEQTYPAVLEPIRGTSGAHHLVIRGTVTLDPQTFAAGSALGTGPWMVVVRVKALGAGRGIPVRGTSRPPAGSRAHGTAKLRMSGNGRLKLVVKQSGPAPARRRR
jgi:hypothetical protein